ncbi:PLDc N-terminal domain-containing protein [Sphingobacterium hotanense]|uniref:PLDc N-terminal domain-containing protein n=1 Tax=Sphingobacterium hotanense TaxID=649196 RepID=A0ABT7NSG8_9SPHI|nr:PLDc N-terminal domain-containing protein [Sphingobacterium hotanense]
MIFKILWSYFTFCIGKYIGIQEVILLSMLIPTIFYLYSFYRLVVSRNINANEKLLWIVAFLVFNLLGAIAYWIWDYSNNRVRSSRY